MKGNFLPGKRSVGDCQDYQKYVEAELHFVELHGRSRGKLDFGCYSFLAGFFCDGPGVARDGENGPIATTHAI